MCALPSGTVTFLFTDIEGSTRLLRDLGPERYAEALVEHRGLLRSACAGHGGTEVDTQGDAFFYVFTRASDAASAALEAQAALSGVPIRVRMGLHTGEPLVIEDGYVGVDVHRAARIAACGRGGQILCSQTICDLLEGFQLRDLGEHRLKDLTRPERIFQLGDGEFPPPKSLNQTNLPIAASPLVGRQQELTELVELLRSDRRLVTVTGAGGSGKTRLALQAAAEVVDDFADGVFWVSFAALRDPELVVPAIAQTLGAKGELVEHVRAKEILLLLDNLEQLLDAAPALADLLAAAPNLKLLTTSRSPLRLEAEREFPLEPLAEGEAVSFFLAKALDAGQELVADETVSMICRRLDRLPLALELAAARVRLLDPSTLLRRLERVLPLLTGGLRDAPERQRTLRATIEWSYELLDEEVRRLFAALAVFAGSFSLEAAEEICGADLESVAALVDQSLLKPIDDGRFLMLETIREYALERLAAIGEEEQLRERHADAFTVLAEQAHMERYQAEGEWLPRLKEEHDNLRAALDWAAERDAERQLRLAGCLGWFWASQSHLIEGRLRLAQGLERSGDRVGVARPRIDGPRLVDRVGKPWKRTEAVRGEPQHLARARRCRGDGERARDARLGLLERRHPRRPPLIRGKPRASPSARCARSDRPGAARPLQSAHRRTKRQPSRAKGDRAARRRACSRRPAGCAARLASARRLRAASWRLCSRGRALPQIAQDRARSGKQLAGDSRNDRRGNGARRSVTPDRGTNSRGRRPSTPRDAACARKIAAILGGAEGAVSG